MQDLWQALNTYALMPEEHCSAGLVHSRQQAPQFVGVVERAAEIVSAAARLVVQASQSAAAPELPPQLLALAARSVEVQLAVSHKAAVNRNVGAAFAATYSAVWWQNGVRLLKHLDAAGDDLQQALASAGIASTLAAQLLLVVDGSRAPNLDTFFRTTATLLGHLRRNGPARAALVQPGEGAATWQQLAAGMQRAQLPARARTQIESKLQLIEAALQAPSAAEAAAAEAAAAAAADAAMQALLVSAAMLDSVDLQEHPDNQETAVDASRCDCLCFVQ